MPSSKFLSHVTHLSAHEGGGGGGGGGGGDDDMKSNTIDGKTEYK